MLVPETAGNMCNANGSEKNSQQLHAQPAGHTFQPNDTIAHESHEKYHMPMAVYLDSDK